MAVGTKTDRFIVCIPSLADSVLHIAAVCSDRDHHMTERQEDREESVPAEQEVGLLKEELNLA